MRIFSALSAIEEDGAEVAADEAAVPMPAPDGEDAAVAVQPDQDHDERSKVEPEEEEMVVSPEDDDGW